jgi:hypothetical protein
MPSPASPLAAGRIGGTIGAAAAGSKMKSLVEVVIIVIVIYAAVRFFRR